MIARFVVLAPLLCAACVAVLPEPPPPARIYRLTATDTPTRAAVPVALVVAVAPPFATRMTAGTDIVWRRDGELAVMDRGAWDGAAVDLLQTLLVDTIDRSGAVRSAVRVGDGARADLEPRWDVERFEVEETGSSLTAHFAVNARVIDTRTRQVLEDYRTQTSAPIGDRSGRVAAAALEQAARAGAEALAVWVNVQAQTMAASTSK
jgi:ABC-type uncharacterized transport system auxiliary subunit